MRHTLKLAQMLMIAGVTTLAAENYTTVSEPVSKQAYSEITPPAGTNVDGFGFSFDGAFTYKEVRQDGLALALNEGSATTQGTVLYPHFKYVPGFKAALGADLPHDDWNVNLGYEWVYSKPSATTTEANYSTALLSDLLSTGAITAVTNELKTYGHFASLTLGRHYFVSQYLSMKPFAGIAGNYIEQYNQTDYTSATSQNIFQSQKKWGAGIVAGLNTVWHLGSNIGIYADSSVSTLWSRFFAVNTVDNAAATPVVQQSNVKNKPQAIQAVLDASFGLQYTMEFEDNLFAFTGKLGWDQKVAFNNNYWNGDAKNLSLQGAVVALSADF